MTQRFDELAVTRLVKYEGEGSVRAFCDLAIGEQFLVRGVKVVNGKRGLFVSMPRQQGKNGTWYDSVSALTKEAKAAVDRVVLEAYEHADNTVTTAA